MAQQEDVKILDAPKPAGAWRERLAEGLEYFDVLDQAVQKRKSQCPFPELAQEVFDAALPKQQLYHPANPKKRRRNEASQRSNGAATKRPRVDPPTTPSYW